MSVSYWMDSSKDKKAKRDIVIIGGGIAGLSSAYWLLKEDPNLKISIVEKYELGDGATGRNAGFVTCGSVEHFNRLVEKNGEKDALQIWQFSEENLRLLKEHIIQDREEEFSFEDKGSFSLASTDVEMDELSKSCSLMKNLGINTSKVDRDELEREMGLAGFVGGIKYHDDASVHPLKLLRGLRESLLTLGDKVEILENHEVISISDKGGQKLVRTKKVLLEAELVIYATNGYSRLLNPFFEDKIFPTRGQILATKAVPKFLKAPCYANFVLDYFRQLPSGELIIGGFRQLQKDVEIGYSDETSPVIQEALENFLYQHMPTLKGKIEITHRWSGVMGFSFDGQPMVGSFPSDPQSFFLGGFTAHGLGLAFHSGKVLCDGIFGRKIPDFISAQRLK